MKKIIIIIIIAIMYIFNIPKTYADDGLKIDSGSLKNSNNNAYISITDIYGVPLFTEKTIKQKEENQIQEKNKLEEINNNIFLDVKSLDSSEKDEFIKLVEKNNLFIKPKEETKIKYIQKEDSDGFISVSIIIILLCILTAILTRKYYKYNSQKEDDSSEYNNYVRS
jgi:hypothetical protein